MDEIDVGVRLAMVDEEGQVKFPTGAKPGVYLHRDDLVRWLERIDHAYVAQLVMKVR